jgi:5-formyltetrahydrofolate cyclo-ligase
MLETLVVTHTSGERDMHPGPAGKAPEGKAPARKAPESKAELRRRFLAARAAMTPGGRDTAARRIRDAILGLPETGMAGTVAAYYSVGTEPGTRGLVYALWKRGSYVLLPRFLPGGELDWASYEGPGSLSPAGHGLLEPTAPGRGEDAIGRASLVIVPALAVDSSGTRLGRGRGCYDRALARVPAAVPAIALLYDGELVTSLPSEPHDQQVRMVAQPGTGITRLL